MRVALLTGGRSGEHDVALETARAVEGALDALGHARLRVVFGRQGGAAWADPGGDVAGQGAISAALSAMERFGTDVAFIAMHGSDGEDGRIQGALDLLGIPYQGSGMAASALGLDKARTKEVFRAAGLPVAPDRVLRADDDDEPDWGEIAGALGMPLFLKTAESGSSVGVERVDSMADLRARGRALLGGTRCLTIEGFLPGIELTAAILEDEDGAPTALPLVEIVPVDAVFFDYEAKYTPGATDEICPARIPEDLAREVERLGLAAHRALGCRGYSRTDVVLDGDGQPRLLETNTLPGLTTASLFPKAATVAGLTFPELIARLLARAVAAGGRAG